MSQVTKVYVGTLEKWNEKKPHPKFYSDIKTDDATHIPREY